MTTASATFVIRQVVKIDATMGSAKNPAHRLKRLIETRDNLLHQKDEINDKIYIIESEMRACTNE